ncbi:MULTISPECIES: hypothetical protein [unclassified Streptomyces]|uniref:hypothetical protein n=1 Tax=unclassified Streptomyces TaxID=2593676 RepID=UPI0037FE7464
MGKVVPWIPVCGTNKIPGKAWRSGTRRRPSACWGGGSGGSASMRDHDSSDAIHGRD